MSEQKLQVKTDRTWHRRVMSRVDSGREGKNVLLPAHPLKRASRHIGIGKRLYTLIGADSGVGKSAFTNSCYVLGPYSHWRKADERGEAPFDVEWHVRVMERDLETTVGKWICSVLYGKYRILMDVNYLFGRGSQRAYMPDEIYELVRETEEYVDRMQDKVHIRTGTENPTGLWRHMERIAKENGTLEKDKFNRITYTPYDEQKVIVYVIDHIGLLQGETDTSTRTKSNGGDKVTLDKMGEYLKTARDVFGFSPVVVCQFNRSQFDQQRRKSELFEVEPRDFHGSSQMFWDADQAIGLLAPHRLGFAEYKKYHVGKLISPQGHNRFRTMTLIKNNIGLDNISFGLHFIGECGLFLELPKPQDMTDAIYDDRRLLPSVTKRLVMSED